MRDGTKRCIWCGKLFIAEEFLTHPCFIERNPVKEIIIDFHYKTESPDGDETIHAYGLSGNIYRLTKPNPTKLKALQNTSSQNYHTKINTPKEHTDKEQC